MGKAPLEKGANIRRWRRLVGGAGSSGGARQLLAEVNGLDGGAADSGAKLPVGLQQGAARLIRQQDRLMVGCARVRAEKQSMGIHS